jgi:thiol-disulfide isomerase/thioredoxin
MKTTVRLLMLALLVARPAVAQTIGDATAQETALKQLPMIDAAGHRLSLQPQPGQVLIVDFWAHWCPSCIVEMSGYEKLQKDLGPDKIKIVLVSGARDWEQDQSYAAAHNIPFPLYVTGQASSEVIARALRGEVTGNGQVSMSLPIAAIFLPNGHLLGSATGERDWGSEEVEKNLRAVAEMK